MNAIRQKEGLRIYLRPSALARVTLKSKSSAGSNLLLLR